MQLAFQRPHRLEGRQEKCRVTARDHAHQDAAAGQCQPEQGIAPGHDQVAFRQVAVGRQGQRSQHDAQHHGEGGQQHRFGQELPHQGRTGAAQRLAYAHFPHPSGGTGRGQVHKINTGDQQNKGRDGAEDPDVTAVAIR